jgi:hypothetical protein
VKMGAFVLSPVVAGVGTKEVLLSYRDEKVGRLIW